MNILKKINNRQATLQKNLSTAQTATVVAAAAVPISILLRNGPQFFGLFGFTLRSSLS